MRADGAMEAGQRRINLSEADIVRRIFREYSHGMSPREIAKWRFLIANQILAVRPSS